MRAETVIAMTLVLAGNLIDTWAWPIFTAIGQTLAFACNWAALIFVQHSLTEASRRDITTVPKDISLTGLALFRTWLPGSAFYAMVVWLIGSLIYLHVLHDIAVYAISVVAINIFLLYLVKCGINASPIRVCITRACLAAERLRVTFNERV